MSENNSIEKILSKVKDNKDLKPNQACSKELCELLQKGHKITDKEAKQLAVFFHKCFECFSEEDYMNAIMGEVWSNLQADIENLFKVHIETKKFI